MTNLDSILKSRDITLPTKVRVVKAMVFPVVMYGCESWTVKKAERRRIDAFELWCWRRLSRVPWKDSNQSKEIQPVHSEGDQPWDFFGRTDAKAETPVLWPPHAKSWLVGKDSDAGRDWGQVEKGTAEDEMAGWHHWLDGRESGWTLGVGDGQGGLACCDSWGRKESDTTEPLNWTELGWKSSHLLKEYFQNSFSYREKTMFGNLIMLQARFWGFDTALRHWCSSVCPRLSQNRVWALSSTVRPLGVTVALRSGYAWSATLERASSVAQWSRICLQCRSRRSWGLDPWVWKI